MDLYDGPDSNPAEDDLHPEAGERRQAGVTPEAQRLPVADTAAPVPASGNCVIIGPAGSGKTNLILAMHQACNCQEPGEPPLELVQENEAMAGLIQHSARMILSNSPLESSLRRQEYQFSICAPSEDGGLRTLSMRMHDGWGGALFPNKGDDPEKLRMQSDWQSKMIEAAHDSRFMVLCVDSTTSAASLYLNLPDVIPKMLLPCPIWQPQRNAAPWWGRFGRRSAPLVPRPDLLMNRLPFSRVLVLLTKVDQLCALALENIRAGGAVPLPPFLTEMTAARLAAQLDPLECAREILGSNTLYSLRSAMRPDATLAIGVSSGGGFCGEDGTPFLDRQGVPNATSETERERLFSRWRPFGVREAIYFLASGSAGRTLRIANREDLLIRRNSYASKIVERAVKR